MFKVGDKVKCRSSDSLRLRVGDIYTVTKIEYPWIGVAEDPDSDKSAGWHYNRFEVIQTSQVPSLSEQVKALEEHRETLLKEIDTVLKQMDDSLQAMQELSKELKEKIK